VKLKDSERAHIAIREDRCTHLHCQSYFSPSLLKWNNFFENFNVHNKGNFDKIEENSRSLLQLALDSAKILRDKRLPLVNSIYRAIDKKTKCEDTM